MFIRLSKSKTTKFTKVYLAEGYRDENVKSKQRIIHCSSNLEELEAKDPDIYVFSKNCLYRTNKINLTSN